MGIEVICTLVLLSALGCIIIVASTMQTRVWWQKLSQIIVYAAAGTQLGAVVVYLTNLVQEYFK